MSETLKFTHFDGKKLSWRNMQGHATDNVPAGIRSFAMIIEDDLAEELERDGWTCISHKLLKKTDPEGPIVSRLKVKINFNSPNPPRIYVSSSDGKRRTLVDESWLDEQNIDRRSIEWVHVSVNPYRSHVNGKDWCTAYLDEMIIKLSEGAFDNLYRDDN